ncbi:T9SS type A sorting domain-containing protein [Marinilabilia rubra]|uniref:Secretion system C-terminal sorting domain-containing protein n=1 Tax=Marinilabilia rubra TaxID=2162893 RepID=A0A2U2BDX1_9BACT|nr:T9SS type A sorting domain-containing protein [Marinilabilia rubra]PWE01227.1 hypothetical protein DDZ16_01700 [Marinilabilia rubra]
MMHFYNNSKQLVRSILIGILFLSFTTLGVHAQVQIMVTTDGGAFVDANSHGTWATATSELQTAIDAAAVATGGGTIWIEGGTYYPTKRQAADPASDPEAVDISGNPRHATFVMASNVTVMGGFEGTETTAAERPSDLFGTTNRVTLSGDIDQDGVDPDNDSYHVVLFPLGVDNSAILEDVYITGGLANGANYFSFRGGGVHMREDGTLNNCVITENGSSDGGGGAYLYKGGLITESEISNNLTPSNGAGILLNLGGTVSNSLIHSNHSTDNSVANGAGVFFDSEPGLFGTLTHCVVATNLSDDKGGGIGTFGEASIINNLILSNEALGNGGGIFLQGGGTVLNNTVVANYSDLGPGVYADTQGAVYNSVLWNNENPYSNVQFVRTDNSTIIDFTAIQGGATGTGITNVINLSTSNSDPGSGTENYPEFRDPVSFAAQPLTSSEVETLLNSDFRINLTSALLDAGNDAFAGIPSFDLGGNQRITKGVIDIGAYEALYYTVTGAVSGSNGTIDPVGPANYLAGEEVVITLTPEEGYDVSTFTINSTDYFDQIADQGDSYTYTEASISDDIDAVVSFGIPNSLAETGLDAFNVYPIPTNDQLFIEGIEINGLEIYSASGKLVKQLKGNIESPVVVSDLTKGLYILIIEDISGEVRTVRFVKN